MTLNPAKIQEDIIRILRVQGYEINNGLIEFPKDATKEDFRRMNELAVAYRIEKAEPALRRYEEILLRYIAEGEEVIPERVQPKLVHVNSGTEEALLFRYASLHWSIPVSSGYGRRLRFLVMDESNGKLIGLFGLGDPVYAIRNRDKFIGWDSETKKEKLYHVMDVYVLGAVPPYSTLLCGKLVALLTLSNEVREIFHQKHIDRKTLIRGQIRPPWLVLLTTTSALGRSSIYNRIKLNGYEFWRSLGFTQGSGEFHFSNGVYEQIRAYVESNCEPTAKNTAWGKGFRSRREVIKKCLPEIGLSNKLLYHGIKREIFVALLAGNGVPFLRGEISRPSFYDWPVEELSQEFLDRWLLPRAERVPEYRTFRRESFRIWS
ncbi:MAG: hypothetical protein DDT33_00866 [Firmicutes bacterium]|nr:hypothetical protein [Bacillota bacterium]